jgi:hypothetical protein
MQNIISLFRDLNTKENIGQLFLELKLRLGVTFGVRVTFEETGEGKGDRLSWPGFRGHHVIGYYSGIPYDPDSVA